MSKNASLDVALLSFEMLRSEKDEKEIPSITRRGADERKNLPVNAGTHTHKTREEEDLTRFRLRHRSNLPSSFSARQSFETWESETCFFPSSFLRFLFLFLPFNGRLERKIQRVVRKNDDI